MEVCMIKSATDAAQAAPVVIDPPKALLHEVYDACLPITEKATSETKPLSAWDCVVHPRIGAQVTAAIPSLISCQRKRETVPEISATETFERIERSPNLLRKAREIQGTAGAQLLYNGGSCFGHKSPGMMDELSRKSGLPKAKCREDLGRIINRV